MTIEEAQKVAEVCSDLDSRLAYRDPSLIDRLNHLFPDFYWTRTWHGFSVSKRP